MVMMMIKFSSYASRMRAEDAAERKLGWLKKSKNLLDFVPSTCPDC